VATVGSPFKNGTAFLSSGWLLFTVAQHIPHSISRGVNSITRTCAIFSIHLRKLIGEQHAAAVVAKMRFIVCRHSVYKLPRDSAGCAPSSITVLHPYAHILSLYARWKLLVCPQLAAAQLSPKPSRSAALVITCDVSRSFFTSSVRVIFSFLPNIRPSSGAVILWLTLDLSRSQSARLARPTPA
jgi:hypothetical protein